MSKDEERYKELVTYCAKRLWMHKFPGLIWEEHSENSHFKTECYAEVKVVLDSITDKDRLSRLLAQTPAWG